MIEQLQWKHIAEGTIVFISIVMTASILIRVILQWREKKCTSEQELWIIGKLKTPMTSQELYKNWTATFPEHREYIDDHRKNNFVPKRPRMSALNQRLCNLFGSNRLRLDDDNRWSSIG